MGEKEKGIEADFEGGAEAWNQYKLLDGGVVRVRMTVSRIFRVVDDNGTPQFHENGDPSIVVFYNTEVIARQ